MSLVLNYVNRQLNLKLLDEDLRWLRESQLTMVEQKIFNTCYIQQIAVTEAYKKHYLNMSQNVFDFHLQKLNWKLSNASFNRNFLKLLLT